MTVRAVALFCLAALLSALTAPPIQACFGARLRVGVERGSDRELASYATGYYVEAKTGIEPEFVAVDGEPKEALHSGKIDLYLAPADVPVPPGLVDRPVGEVPGCGPSRYWVHPDVLDDLRFFTVDRSLGRIEEFFDAGAYRDAVRSPDPPRKAARSAVLRGQ